MHTKNFMISLCLDSNAPFVHMCKEVSRDGFQVDISCPIDVLHLGGEVSRHVRVAPIFQIWNALTGDYCSFSRRAPSWWIFLFNNFVITWLLSPNNYKKLIMRWDSERALSLRRHCTRTKNTINSTTDRFLQRRFTKFNGITQCNGHYAVQGHSRSPSLVPIESSYATSYQWLIQT